MGDEDDESSTFSASKERHGFIEPEDMEASQLTATGGMDYHSQHHKVTDTGSNGMEYDNYHKNTDNGMEFGMGAYHKKTEGYVELVFGNGDDDDDTSEEEIEIIRQHVKDGTLSTGDIKFK